MSEPNNTTTINLLPQSPEEDNVSQWQKLNWCKNNKLTIKYSTLLIVSTVAVSVIALPRLYNLIVPSEEDKGSESTYFPSTMHIKTDVIEKLPISIRTITLSNASPMDFETITDDITDLHILSVTTRKVEFPTKMKKNIFLQNLTISSPVSDEWITFIFNKFPRLKCLTLHDDSICQTRQPNPNSNTYTKVSLPYLETLIVVSAKNTCPFTQLVWENWEAPSLKHLKISRSHINYSFFQHFLPLLNRTKNTMETIEITETYLCSDCEIMSIPFQKLRKLSIRFSKSINYA